MEVRVFVGSEAVGGPEHTHTACPPQAPTLQEYKSTERVSDKSRVFPQAEHVNSPVFVLWLCISGLFLWRRIRIRGQPREHTPPPQVLKLKNACSCPQSFLQSFRVCYVMKSLLRIFFYILKQIFKHCSTSSLKCSHCLTTCAEKLGGCVTSH